MSRRIVFSVGLCVLALTWAAPAQAAQVAPNVVFINAGERGSEIMVRNGGQGPIEVEVSLLFGYEDTDDQGQVRSIYPEEPGHARSAAGWLRAYPQRTVIPPGSRQSIRLFSRAPSNTPPGEYWARIQVQTRPTQISSESVDDNEEIRVRVGVTTRQRIPVFVRIGEVDASVGVGRVRASLAEPEADNPDSSRAVVARYRVGLSGNAAFLGTMAARVEKDGRILAEQQASLAVFWPGTRRVQIALPDDARAAELEGARLILEARREHPAIQARDLVPGRLGRWEGLLELE